MGGMGRRAAGTPDHPLWVSSDPGSVCINSRIAVHRQRMISGSLVFMDGPSALTHLRSAPTRRPHAGQDFRKHAAGSTPDCPPSRRHRPRHRRIRGPRTGFRLCRARGRQPLEHHPALPQEHRLLAAHPGLQPDPRRPGHPAGHRAAHARGLDAGRAHARARRGCAWRGRTSARRTRRAAGQRHAGRAGRGDPQRRRQQPDAGISRRQPQPGRRQHRAHPARDQAPEGVRRAATGRRVAPRTHREHGAPGRSWRRSLSHPHARGRRGGARHRFSRHRRGRRAAHRDPRR